jgi:hypothetical protein
MSDLDDDRFADEVADLSCWPMDPTPHEECREVIRSELGTITAKTAIEARVHLETVKALDDLLRYNARFPALHLIRDLREGHPAEHYIRAARAALEVEDRRGSPGLARATTARMMEEWAAQGAMLAKNAGPLW